MSDAWEKMYDQKEALRAENDALKLRVAVLEKAVSEASRAKHAANNRCQAVVGVCEEAIRALRDVKLTRHSVASLMEKTLAVALNPGEKRDG